MKREPMRPPTAAEPEQAEWLAWVVQYADHIDPTVNFTLKNHPPSAGSAHLQIH
jgi:hypothetical protein